MTPSLMRRVGKSNLLRLPRLYPITKSRPFPLSHAEQVAALCKGGATFIQLREKTLAPRDFIRDGEVALRIAHDHGARLIVNDRVDIALALGADGVHLGQDDLSPEAARRLMGESAIVGYSTHTLAQATRAVEFPLDYVAFGPIFATSSREKADPIVGLGALSHVRKIVHPIPLVAIGGISASRALEVLDSGADSIAIIGAVSSSDAGEMTQLTREMFTRLATDRST